MLSTIRRICWKGRGCVEKVGPCWRGMEPPLATLPGRWFGERGAVERGSLRREYFGKSKFGGP